MHARGILPIALMALIHTAVCILSGALGWEVQFLVVSIAGMSSIWYISSRFTRLFINSLVVLLPFYVIYIWSSIQASAYQVYSIWIWGLITCFSTYLVARFSRNLWLKISILSFLLLFGYGIVMPNNFAFVYREANPERYELAKAKVINEKELPVELASLKGKVVLFDVWNSACLPCIKRFPELQELSDYYKGDTSVIISSLNVPSARDNGVRPFGITRKYAFDKYYFESEKDAGRLSISAVPLILILDKEGKCVYAGDLNQGWNIFFGNAKRIINHLKSQK